MMEMLLLAAKKNSPTVTYATRDPSNKSANMSLSLSNTRTTATNTSWKSTKATIGKSSGKWYRECVVQSSGGWNAMVGVGNSSASNNSYCGVDVNGRSYYSYQSKADPANGFHNGNFVYGTAYALGNVIGIALDMDNGTLRFYKNNVDQGVMTGLSGTMYPMVSLYDNTIYCTANFGATTMVYTAPSGYNQGLF